MVAKIFIIYNMTLDFFQGNGPGQESQEPAACESPEQSPEHETKDDKATLIPIEDDEEGLKPNKVGVLMSYVVSQSDGISNLLPLPRWQGFMHHTTYKLRGSATMDFTPTPQSAWMFGRIPRKTISIESINLFKHS